MIIHADQADDVIEFAVDGKVADHLLPGLVFGLNNTASEAGDTVRTRWQNTGFKPAAWRGKADLSVPAGIWTDSSGNADFLAPPRGYVMYAPD